MRESRPKILIKKYGSLMLASIVVEFVSYIVSLTDSIIAANRVNLDALTAIGLVSPFFFFSDFIGAIINSGTLLNYSNKIGSFDKKRAHEFFSEGVISSICAGIFVTSILLIIKPLFIKSLNVSPEIIKYLNQYYTIIVFYFMLSPLSYVLENIVASDGGEYLTAFLNILQIVGNLVLSYILAGKYDVVGIAVSTVFCKVIFIILVSFWFFGKRNSVAFVWYFSFSDLYQIVKSGIVKASAYATMSIMLWLLNMFVLSKYNELSFKIWIIDQKLLGLSALFIGMAMTIQPIISVLRAEKNTKALRIILRSLNRDIILIGGVCSLLIILFTGSVLKGFDVSDDKILELAISALRITSVMLIFLAQMTLFFIYYYMIDQYRMALIIGGIKDIICPMGMVVLLEYFWNGNPYTLWAGLLLSQIAAVIITLIIIFIRYGKDCFPFLLPKDTSSVHIFSFDLSRENAVAMSEEAMKLLSEEKFSVKLQTLLGVCIEDILNLVIERNKDSRKKNNCGMYTDF